MTHSVKRMGWIAVLLMAAAGCDSSGGSEGNAAGVETLADVIQESTKPAAPPVAADSSVVASDRDAAEGADTANATGGEVAALPAGSRPASERPPVQSAPGTYWGAISAANRNIRMRLDDVAWKKSVQFFEAEKGFKPRNTQEFMERVRSEGTPLPEIPQGSQYLYVPDEGQFGELYAVPVEQPEAER